MKVIIDKPRCAGHARCASVAPDLFELDEDGYIASEGFDVPEGQEAIAGRGARACPERIITITEDNHD